MSGHDSPAGYATALQRAERAVMALLPDDDTLRATCAGIIERAKIDVRQPSAQRPEPPNIPHRGKNLTQLENSTRGPPHRKLPSRKELYQSLDDLHTLVWPHAPSVMRMQKAREACRSTMAMDAAASMGSDFAPMPVDTGALNPCANRSIELLFAVGAFSRVCALCSVTQICPPRTRRDLQRTCRVHRACLPAHALRYACQVFAHRSRTRAKASKSHPLTSRTDHAVPSACLL